MIFMDKKDPSSTLKEVKDKKNKVIVNKHKLQKTCGYLL